MADTRDPSFGIAAATLTLMDSIIVNYQSIVTSGYNNDYNDEGNVIMNSLDIFN